MMTDELRLLRTRSLIPDTDQYDVNEVRPFYHPSDRQMAMVNYYVVPFPTTTLGRCVAHVDSITGQVIAFKSPRKNLSYHIERVKRRRLDDGIIAIVDNAISQLRREKKTT